LDEITKEKRRVSEALTRAIASPIRSFSLVISRAMSTFWTFVT